MKQFSIWQPGSPLPFTALQPTYVPQQSVRAGVLSEVTELARGMAIVNGEVVTWPSYGDSTYTPTPWGIVGISSAVAIGATNFSAWSGRGCAVLADGTVTCWSQSESVPAPVPGPISGVSGALTVGVGPTHACALISGGTVQCWGSNDAGQLGNGTTTAPTPGTATTVLGLSDATAIFVAGGGTVGDDGALLNAAVGAGDANACAQKADLSVWCWGNASHGEFGTATLGLDPANPVAATPVPVPELQGARSLALGADHACAVLADGSVQCTASAAPWGWVPVSGVQNAISVATCNDQETGHSCALIADGSIMCWGSDTYGQLGDGNYSPSRDP